MTFEAKKYSMKFVSRMAYCIASSKHNKSVAVAVMNNTIDLNTFLIQIVEQLRSSIYPSSMLDDRAKRNIFFLLKMVVCAFLSLHEISNKKGALYEGILFIVGNNLESFSFLTNLNLMMIQVLNQRADMISKQVLDNFDLLVLKSLHEWLNFLMIFIKPFVHDTKVAIFSEIQ
jgi:hypothetical protein